jgi:hypothetical protein
MNTALHFWQYAAVSFVTCLFGASLFLHMLFIFVHNAHSLHFVLLESVQRSIPSNKSTDRSMLGMFFVFYPTLYNTLSETIL